jgi:hypothetical protein
LDEGKIKRVVMARAGTNTCTRTTRERGKGDDPGTGMSTT